MSHLGTRIEGQLHEGHRTTALGLAASLHPTPAVAGKPPEGARLSAGYEGFDRGRYAGPVGWMDSNGDGDWAVGIRSAEIDGARARLFAGVGVVSGSEARGRAGRDSAQASSAARRPGPALTWASARRHRPARAVDGRLHRLVELVVPGHVGGPVGPDQHQPDAALGQAVDHGWGHGGGILDLDHRDPVRRGQLAQVEAVRGSPQRLESVGGEPDWGRNEKMPPPSLSITTTVQSTGRSRAPRSAPAS